MPFGRKVSGISSSTIVVTTVAFFLVCAMLFVASPADADAPSAKSVRGWVWDSAARNVTGASVVINITDGVSDWTTKSDTTDANGFYSVGFLATEWEVGYEIWIIVTYESLQDSDHTPATDTIFQYLNLTFMFEIPEFGSVAGMAIAAFALGGVGVAAVVLWRRK